MDADGARLAVRELSERIEGIDAERARVVRERDEAVRVARERGVTWRELQELSGLSRSALVKALGRVNE